MPQVRILSAAADEAIEAAAHYETERSGLGQQFEDAVYDSLRLLAEDVVPLATISKTLTAAGIRRLVMRRFPYAIVVRKIGDSIEVIAIAHHSRRPGYWRDRLST